MYPAEYRENRAQNHEPNTHIYYPLFCLSLSPSLQGPLVKRLTVSTLAEHKAMVFISITKGGAPCNQRHRSGVNSYLDRVWQPIPEIKVVFELACTFRKVYFFMLQEEKTGWLHLQSTSQAASTVFKWILNTHTHTQHLSQPSLGHQPAHFSTIIPLNLEALQPLSQRQRSAVCERFPLVQINNNNVLLFL